MVWSSDRRPFLRFLGCVGVLNVLALGCDAANEGRSGDAASSPGMEPSTSVNGRTPADGAVPDAAINPTGPGDAGSSDRASPATVPDLTADDWPMALHDALASGYNPSERQLKPDNIARLEIKWRFDSSVAGHDVGPIHATPVVADDTVYVGAMTGRFYALGRDGKLLWQYATWEPSELLVSIKATPVGAAFQADGRATIVGAAVLPAAHPYVIFGDTNGTVYALDRRTGEEVWVKEDVDGHPISGVDGNSLLSAGDVVIVGFASSEGYAINFIDSSVHQCCTFRGSVVALDVATGAEKWRFYTVPEPKPLPSERAPYLLGPSGGSIWGQPSYDEETQTVYVGTGANYSPTEDGGFTEFTDSILALSAATGALKWSYQATKNDIWTEGEFNPRADGIFLDADFGDSPKIYDLPGVGKVIGAGQKTGDYHVLDARSGALVKRTEHLKMYNTLGGFQNLGGYANGVAYGHGTDRIGDPGWLGVGESFNGSVLALSPDGERVLWRFDQFLSPLIGGIALANGLLFFVSPIDELVPLLVDPGWGLYAVDASTGAVLNHLTFPERAISSPVVSRGRVYVTEGNVAFDALGLLADTTGSVISLGLPGD